MLSLVILWSAREPHRIGESALCEPGQAMILGRAPALAPGERALCFSQVRPGLSSPANPELLGEALSRRQIEICAEGDALRVRNLGRCPMWVNGVLSGRAQLEHGDTIHLQQQLLLLCVRQRSARSDLRYPAGRPFTFGHADYDGIVGESGAAWQLREQIAASAGSEGHVLILGSSGVGKELVAQALHRMSSRGQGPLLCENIAAVPPSLGAALLFGNRKNFPNPGMEERTGLIGAAEGGTLFLDEIGDMSAELQPMLLRVMERGGEYLRLGDEGRPRRADVRFIGATNRPEPLRLELRRRFLREIVVPDLNERLEDIPLLVRHILITEARRCDRARRFLARDQPSIDPRLIEQLVRHRYSTHVSELGRMVLRAVQDSERDVLAPLVGDLRGLRQSTPRLAEPVGSPDYQEPAEPGSAAGEDEASAQRVRPLPSPKEAQQALDSAGGSVVQAAARLSITRHQLNRLIRREALSVTRPEGRGMRRGPSEGPHH